MALDGVGGPPVRFQDLLSNLGRQVFDELLQLGFVAHRFPIESTLAWAGSPIMWLNMVIAFVASTIFAFLSRSFRRQKLTYIFSIFIAACLIFFMSTLESPVGGTVWSFYFFGDLYSTLMVSTFFAFLNDSIAPEKAKRLYGLIGLGGVSGGAFGATLLAARIKQLSITAWLAICLGVAGGICVVAGAAGRLFARVPIPETPKADQAAAVTENPATAGARLVFRSRYLLAILAIVGLYEMVSTIMDFQFKSAVAHYLDGEAIGVRIANMYAISNVLSFVVQLFFTSFVMNRFGVGMALLVLPATALIGSVGFC